MTKAYALVVWGPMLVGAIPPLYMLALFGAGVCALGARRYRGSMLIRAGFALGAVYLSVLPTLGSVGDWTHRLWVRDLKRGACGVRPGMTREEVQAKVMACGRDVHGMDGEFSLRPPPPACFAPLDMGVYGLSVTYGKDGKVANASGWSD